MDSGAGVLLVLSGPSGAGKSTVIAKVAKAFETKGVPFFFSVSVTTRQPRPGEVPGEHYQFVTQQEFDALVAQNRLLECAEYAGNCYGTPSGPIDEGLKRGACVFLDIDVVGALQIKQKRPEAVLVFFSPPDMAELERRLRGRGTEPDDKIARRMQIAREEYGRIDEYDYFVVNNDVDQTADELITIIKAEQLRVSRRKETIGKICTQ